MCMLIGCTLFGLVLYFTHEQDMSFKTNDIVYSNYCNFLYNYLGVDKNYNFAYQNYTHEDFTYIPHYVKFHIRHEQKGINVSIKMSNECFRNTQEMYSYTDNNSEVDFPMISSAKYNILIDNNRCSYYIYPSESYYDIYCGVE
jgi:hypothetical protein